MIHTQKCKELCGHDYSDGLLIDSTNVHKSVYGAPVSKDIAILPCSPCTRCIVVYKAL